MRSNSTPQVRNSDSSSVTTGAYVDLRGLGGIPSPNLANISAFPLPFPPFKSPFSFPWAPVHFPPKPPPGGGMFLAPLAEILANTGNSFWAIRNQYVLTAVALIRPISQRPRPLPHRRYKISKPILSSDFFGSSGHSMFRPERCQSPLNYAHSQVQLPTLLPGQWCIRPESPM